MYYFGVLVSTETTEHVPMRGLSGTKIK